MCLNFSLIQPFSIKISLISACTIGKTNICLSKLKVKTMIIQKFHNYPCHLDVYSYAVWGKKSKEDTGDYVCPLSHKQILY